MQTLAQIRAILDQRGLRPKKSLGQNFLIDHNLLRKLVDASGVQRGETVLEVGPGTGTLTDALLERGARVIACELDNDLQDLLRERYADAPVEVIHADCLASDRTLAPVVRDALGDGPFRLVANLPYGAATPLLSTLLIEHPGCRSMSVTIQREVADRLAASPGTKAYGAVSIVAQSLASVTKVATLPGSCFWPPPDVASAMVHLERRTPCPVADARALSDLCRVLFATRRKQLRSVLGDGPLPTGVAPTDRPERLTIEHVAELLRLRQTPRSEG